MVNKALDRIGEVCAHQQKNAAVSFFMQLLHKYAVWTEKKSSFNCINISNCILDFPDDS